MTTTNGESRTVYRTCPLCEATCGLELRLEGKDITLVRGDRDDVFSHGFLCPKGTALKQLESDPDRLRRPQVRRGDSWHEVSWEDAFAEVERGLTPIFERYGRDAVAMYMGNPNVHNLAGTLYSRVLIQAVGFTGIQTNARGLAAMGVTAASTDPGILKDSSGQPTGQLTGTAAALGRATMGKQLRTVSIDEQVACMKAFLREANRVGLTAWDDPAGNDQFDPQGRQQELLAGEHGYQAINQIHRDAQMTARIVLHFSCFTTGVPALDCVKQYTPTAVSLVGDDWLRIGGMGEELTTNMTNGLYPMPDYQLAVDYLAQNRWNLEHHAQSPAQQAEVVEAWERANAKASIKDLGWRMLHPFGGAAYPTNDVLGKLKALGAGVVLTNSNMQGQLTQEHPPYKRVYDSGTRMCLGTDALNVSTYAPFNNLWYTISGKTLDPAVVGVQPDQRLTRDQALRSATVNCAWFVHMENKVGTLEPGRYADFVVLSKDYFTVPVDEIRTITSVLTVAGGKVGWASGDFASLAPKQ